MSMRKVMKQKKKEKKIKIICVSVLKKKPIINKTTDREKKSASKTKQKTIKEKKTAKR